MGKVEKDEAFRIAYYKHVQEVRPDGIADDAYDCGDAERMRLAFVENKRSGVTPVDLVRCILDVRLLKALVSHSQR